MQMIDAGLLIHKNSVWRYGFKCLLQIATDKILTGIPGTCADAYIKDAPEKYPFHIWAVYMQMQYLS